MGSRCVEETLEIMYEKKTILSSVIKLKISEMHDPRLLEGLKTAFPNLRELIVTTSEEMDSRGEVSGMELGVVLKACGDWGTLKHLEIVVPSYPKQIMDIIQALLDAEAKGVFKGE